MKHAFLITCYKDIKALTYLVNDIKKIKKTKIFINADKQQKNFVNQLKLIKKKIIYTLLMTKEIRVA